MHGRTRDKTIHGIVGDALIAKTLNQWLGCNLSPWDIQVVPDDEIDILLHGHYLILRSPNLILRSPTEEKTDGG